MKKYAVIVAGGAGTRMGTQSPKQFLLLRGKPVLWHTLTVFLNAYEDLEIILVLPEEHLETGRAIVNSMGVAGAAGRRVRIVGGGVTRFHSVQKGLRLIEQDGLNEMGERGGIERSVIFVHDGVRCLLTEALVHRCYEGAVEYGSAIPVIDSRDSVRLIAAKGNEAGGEKGIAEGTGRGGKFGGSGAAEGKGGMGKSEAVERHRVKLVQTPQTFLSSVILPAYAVEYQERFTDEATVVETAGHPVHLVEGEINNIKITMPADLSIAELLLRSTDD
jgi:2-C-methyl-D-erythritol 4-phosphate cytidylyltransferase